MQSEIRTVEHDTFAGTTEKASVLDSTSAVFLVSLIVRLIVAAVFLGSVDTINSLSFMPVAASHGYFYLPYFPIVENILGSSAWLMSHIHFLPIGVFPKLLPCFADSLLSVWLLHYDRFDTTFRRRAAWIYAFCPLAIILVCLQGQWDSLWILPMIAAMALSMQIRDGSPKKFRTGVLIGLLLGVAVVAKPVAILVAGLLISNIHSRASLTSWIKELSAIVTGVILSVGVFLVVFASEGINLRRNLDGIIGYGSAPGFIVFGPAHLSIFHFLAHLQKHGSVIGDFRVLALIYVLGIVGYQVFSRAPIETMTAAASILLIASAIGGLAPQYLVWPLMFIIASGRLRLAVVYSGLASFLVLMFFLIPGSSVEPGESIGTFLPLHSLSFLGVPQSVLHWAATTAFTQDVWLPILNLYLPVVMCSLALYLLMSKWRVTRSEERTLLDPRELRATKVCVAYAALLIMSIAIYWLEPTHVERHLVGVIQTGLTHYGFVRTIYSVSNWQRTLFWTVSTPYKDVLGGSWWGSIIVIGPFLILLWCYFALRSTRFAGTGGGNGARQS